MLKLADILITHWQTDWDTKKENDFLGDILKRADWVADMLHLAEMMAGWHTENLLTETRASILERKLRASFLIMGENSWYQADILTTCWLGLTHWKADVNLGLTMTDFAIDCFPGLFNYLIPAWHRLNDESWLIDWSDIMTALTLWLVERRCLICWQIRSNLQTYMHKLTND